MKAKQTASVESCLKLEGALVSTLSNGVLIMLPFLAKLQLLCLLNGASRIVPAPHASQGYTIHCLSSSYCKMST